MSRIDAASVQGLRQLLSQPALRPGITPGTLTPGRPGDSVALRQGHSAGSLALAKQRLDQLDVLLTELKSLTSDQARPDNTVDHQREIDALIASIDQAAAEVALRRGFDHIALTNVSPEVLFSDITEANLDPGESLDLEIFVRQSAQQGALFLSMGGTSLNLGGATSTFTLEIAGSLGTRALSFSSSMTLSNIAAGINAFSKETGVHAVASGTGIALQSTGFGSGDFTSVKVLSHGGIHGADNLGIYQMLEDDADTPDGTTGVSFQSLQAFRGIDDPGQDIVAAVDGEPVYGQGATLTFATAKVSGTIELATGELTDPRGANAQNLGLLQALTVSVLKTADNQGELATAPDAPDTDALHSRVSNRLSFLQLLHDAGITHLPPTLASWSGAEAGQVDADRAAALAAEARHALITGRHVTSAHDPSTVLQLLG